MDQILLQNHAQSHLFHSSTGVAGPRSNWSLAIALFLNSRLRPRNFPACPASRNQPFSQFAAADCKVCVVVASGPRQSAALTTQLKVAPLASGKPQSYGIRRASQNGQDVVAVLASDANGAMYGALDVAESLRLGTLRDLKPSDHEPHIENRGIKFNVPLDARTPSYSDNADAAQNNIPEMWSADFWHEFIDEMARYRYNVLSLWNLHPFPSMVKTAEYPDVALADVKRTKTPMDDTYSLTGSDMVRPELLANLETVRTLTIDQKIAFLERDHSVRQGSRHLRLHHHVEHFHVRRRRQVWHHVRSNQSEHHRPISAPACARWCASIRCSPASESPRASTCKILKANSPRSSGFGKPTERECATR